MERRIFDILAMCMELNEVSYKLLFSFDGEILDIFNFTNKDNVVYKRAYLKLDDADKELAEIEEYLKELM